MSRFRGRFDYSIDEKGRINIPFKFRNLMPPEAQSTFVICRAPDGCLWAYPLNEWEKFEDSLIAMPMTKGVNRFQREIQNTLCDSVLDKQGRVTLTPHQIQIAGIKKDVSIVGRGRHLEIWGSERFEDYTGNGEEFDELYYKMVKTVNPRG